MVVHSLHSLDFLDPYNSTKGSPVYQQLLERLGQKAESMKYYGAGLNDPLGYPYPTMEHTDLVLPVAC